MWWRRLVVLIFAIGAAQLGFRRAALAQSPAVAPQTSLSGELASLALRAAVVFAGQVTSIDRKGGVVEVRFRVDQQVVGKAGPCYTLREWAGLWPPGLFRYAVGQHVLIFLHGTSAAGLGSPVDGAEGVVPVVPQGAHAPALLDVRRLSSALLRPVGTPLATEANGAIQLADAVGIVQQAHQGRFVQPHEPLRWRLPSSTAAGVDPIAGAGSGGATRGPVATLPGSGPTTFDSEAR